MRDYQTKQVRIIGASCNTRERRSAAPYSSCFHPEFRFVAQLCTSFWLKTGEIWLCSSSTPEFCKRLFRIILFCISIWPAYSHSASLEDVKSCLQHKGNWQGDIFTGYCDQTQQQWIKLAEQCINREKTWEGPVGPNGHCVYFISPE